MSSTTHHFAEHNFRKSGRSEPDKNCVQLARRDGVAQLRDSKAGFGAVNDGRLTVSTEQFDAFARALRP